MPDGSHPARKARAWNGPTYYGRSQLKPAPFNNFAVGGYVFLAGLSGGSMLVSTVAELTGHGRREDGGLGGAVGRRGRLLATLAPTLGSAVLVWDLHTPQRFMNMMRVAKRTSPMSIGTWILLGFSAFAMPAALAEVAADRTPWPSAIRRVARLAAVPASLFGAGLGTYTAALLAATSTPLWAAAPRALAVRFASSSIAAGAGALGLGEGDPRTRRALDVLAVAALATEAVAAEVSHRRCEQCGVGEALRSTPGRIEYWGAHVAGTLLPACLKAVSVLLGPRRGRVLSGVGSALSVAGSGLFRVSIMAAGDVSARDPNISFRFAQPDNLPDRPRDQTTGAARPNRRDR